jgi:hypothetical protein
LRTIALRAADVLDQFQMDGPEGDEVEFVARMLRERAAGMQPVAELGGGR